MSPFERDILLDKLKVSATALKALENDVATERKYLATYLSEAIEAGESFETLAAYLDYPEALLRGLVRSSAFSNGDRGRVAVNRSANGSRRKDNS